MKPELDDYVTDDNDGVQTRASLVSWAVMGVAAFGFIALAWYAFQHGGGTEDATNIALIEADTMPIKRAPKDPGGEEFLHKDKTIYDAIAADDQATALSEETLLPEPETPVIPILQQPEPETVTPKETPKAVIAPEKPKPMPTMEKPATPLLKEAAKKASEEAQKKENKGADAREISTQETKNSLEEKTIDAPKTIAEKAPKPEVKSASVEVKKEPIPTESKPVKTAPVLAGNFAVQLGAYKSQAEAEAEWQKIYNKHVGALSGTREKIIRANLPTGTYYRLRVVGFASADAAKAACGKLSSGGQACFYAGKQ